MRVRVGVLLGIACAFAGAEAAQAKVPVKVAVRSLDRGAIAERGALTVRVAARRRTTVRVAAGGLARPATLRFRRAGGRTVRLRLTSAGRRAVRNCSFRRITVTARARRGGQKRTGRTRRTLRACRRSGGSGEGGGAGGRGGGGSAPSGPGSRPPAPEEAGFATPAGCDFLDAKVCLFPFPNDEFTRADPATPTGRRIAFADSSMPRNREGKPIAAGDYRLSDGFSPGQKMVTHVPGLDSNDALRLSGAPTVDDPQRSLSPQSPVVVLDAASKARHLVWAEVDANPAEPADRNLLIRPATNLAEGRRYVVALRRLTGSDGKRIEAARPFRVYRDRIPTTSQAVEARRPRMERLFAELAAAGVAREDLYLAWEFTVASAPSTTGRMLSIRDRAFAELGDEDLADLTVEGAAPAYELNPDIPDGTPQPSLPVGGGLPVGVPAFRDLDGVRDFKPCTAGADPQACEEGEDARIARVVRGTMTVPCFLDQTGCPPGSRFALGADGLPQRIPGNVAAPAFTCIVPRVAVDPADAKPARPSLYGHGLFGGQGEIGQGQLKDLANEHGFVFCATDWDGMATRDVPTAFAALQDLSEFPRLIDHVQQGFLHFLYLGRLMIHPDGFGADPAFRPKGESVIDPERLFYDGNSQGGIYGGSLAAIAPDFQRAVLGVPGMNYSTLLRRSVDFDLYANGEFGTDTPLGLYDAYPSEVERPLVLSLIQMLWDRGDPNGYAAHMTDDPLPNTPPHEVLLHVGFGDHQVADIAATAMARSAGARVHTPALEPGRPRFTAPPYPGQADGSFSGLEPLGPAGYSATGSGLVFWDIGPQRTEGGEERGTAPPPAANLPPREGRDPHESPRRTAAARRQKSAFLRASGGRVVDVCGGPCFADGYAGAP